MLVNGNLVGFGMFVFAALVIAVGKFIVGLPDPIVMISAGATVAVVDIALRLMNVGREGWLMGSKTGGYLFFVPAWIFGVVVVIINVAALFFKTK